MFNYLWKNKLPTWLIFAILPSSNTSADFAKGKIRIWPIKEKTPTLKRHNSFILKTLLNSCRSLLLGLGIANFAYALDIQNPIAPVSSFPQLIDRIASALRTIVMPLAIAAIIFVGFKFVSAAASGNQAELTKAKTMLWWVLIGTAIVIGASVLAQAVVNFASGLGS